MAKGGQPVPVVMCPGCKKAMRLRLLEPASGNLETATFYCEQCGTETKREFAWEQLAIARKRQLQRQGQTEKDGPRRGCASRRWRQA